MLFILLQGISTVKAFRQYKKEQSDAIQAERDELAAEKKRTEEMMAEIKALREQLGGSDAPGNEDKE